MLLIYLVFCFLMAALLEATIKNKAMRRYLMKFAALITLVLIFALPFAARNLYRFRRGIITIRDKGGLLEAERMIEEKRVAIFGGPHACGCMFSKDWIIVCVGSMLHVAEIFLKNPLGYQPLF